MNNKDIIITGIQSWDIKIGSNCKNIALEFSKQNSVLYINPPMDRSTHLRGKLKSIFNRTGTNPKKQFIRQVNSNLWIVEPQIIIESISQLSNRLLFDKINLHNNIKFAKEIKRAARGLGFNVDLLFTDSDMFRSFYLMELLKPKLFAYYSRDNLLAVSYWQKQGLRIEPEIMKKADLVLANSTYLANIGKQYNPRSFFIGQGCDVSEFNPNIEYKLPGYLKSISRPVIGYIGSLNSIRLDINLISSIAVKKPDWSIVLVGPEDDAFRKSNLHHLKNVHFLGSKPEKELPVFLSGFDVAINPQKVNEVTIGNYPRKIDEYLAMGKPTVATHTETMEYFRDYVSLAGTLSEWIESIEFELENNSPEKAKARIGFANCHTWANNVDEIYKQIVSS